MHSPGKQALSDFTEIRARIASRAPDIETFIVTNGQRHSVATRTIAQRPTLVFSPSVIRDFRPARGKVYACRPIAKSDEYQRLVGAGVPTPETVIVRQFTVLDGAWGPFTVLKPNTDTLQGRGVRLVRTVDVRWIDPMAWPRHDPRFGREMIAQRFADSGTFAECHRVMLVLGRPIYCLTSRSRVARPELNAGRVTNIPIAANAGGSEGRTLALNFDADIIELGKRAAAAFPEAPNLGVDIIREQGTGRLFVLEVNFGVNTWHLSSDYFEPHRRKYRLDLHGQFGALDIIADALIDVTRREAA